jgi:hypothetical protein
MDSNSNPVDVKALEQRVAALEDKLKQRVVGVESALGQRIRNLELGAAHLAYRSEFWTARENLRQAGRKMDLQTLSAALVDFVDVLIAATSPEVLLRNKE